MPSAGEIEIEIEARGRGIARIFSACRLGSAPEPQLRLDGGGLWTAFHVSCLQPYRLTDAGSACLQALTPPEQP